MKKKKLPSIKDIELEIEMMRPRACIVFVTGGKYYYSAPENNECAKRFAENLSHERPIFTFSTDFAFFKAPMELSGAPSTTSLKTGDLVFIDGMLAFALKDVESECIRIARFGDKLTSVTAPADLYVEWSE